MNGDSADWNTAARLRLDQKSMLEVKLVEGPPSGTHRDFKASTGRTRETKTPTVALSSRRCSIPVMATASRHVCSCAEEKRESMSNRGTGRC
jgi:hypothetical protein